MSAQDNIEKVLRSLHVLLSKSEPYQKEPSKVIVDKEQVLELLSELNKCVYGIMDEYEMTQQSRDRAQREFQKKGDEIVWDASRKAEDIYAASVMYTDEALSYVQEAIKEANASIEEIYTEMNRKLEEQEKVCRKNQLELKSQLQNLVDTEKYLKLIEERNREREKEKVKSKGNINKQEEASIYANRQTEIKINQEYFEKMGISLEEEPEEKEELQKEAEIRMDLDADYFKWKEETQEDEKEKSSKGKGELFQNVLKNITSQKR